MCQKKHACFKMDCYYFDIVETDLSRTMLFKIYLQLLTCVSVVLYADVTDSYVLESPVAANSK